MEYQSKDLKYIDADIYDKRSESSVLEKYVLDFWQPFIKSKISKLSAGRIMIDWGCGTGEYVLAAKNAKKIYCIDISDIMLEKAKEKLKNFNQVEFINSSGFNNEIADNIGELILTIGVWEYVDPIKLLKEIKRLTKRGSLVLVVLPNIFNSFNIMRSFAKMKIIAIRPGFIKKIFQDDFLLVDFASFGMVFWFPKKLQFLVFPIWKLLDLLWKPFHKFFPLGINTYYLFERK